MAHLEAFLAMCDNLAQKYGITIALEPLNNRETNMIITLAEGASLVRRVNASGYNNIKLLADTYHMSREPSEMVSGSAETRYNEDCFAVLKEAEDIIVHMHAAEVTDRTYPGSHDGIYLKHFAGEVKKTAYTRRISVECGFKDFLSESAAALKFLRGIF
jgi:sugar phosphate isomerase/epimerase